MMTTILEEPYMMLRKEKPGEILRGNDRYEGYCKDLADAITRLTGIKFLIRPVKDGKYGSPDQRAPGGWNGNAKIFSYYTASNIFYLILKMKINLMVSSN